MPREGIMLAYKWDEKRFSKWKKPVIVQPKLNGDRCRAVFDAEGKVQLLSSGIKDRNFAVPHIVAELEDLGFVHIELDGELYVHGMHHNEIRGIVSRTIDRHSNYDEISYHIFDVVSTVKQYIRTSLLSEYIHSTTSLQRVESCEVNDITEFQYHYERYVADGYEGIIARNSNGLYKRKKSTDMMKLKPFLSDTFVVVGYEEEISIHGNAKG